MAKILAPSSFECDCGHASHFFENTVKEMKKMSQKKRVRLGDGSNKEHTVIFYKETVIEIICPKLGRCKVP